LDEPVGRDLILAVYNLRGITQKSLHISCISYLILHILLSCVACYSLGAWCVLEICRPLSPDTEVIFSFARSENLATEMCQLHFIPVLFSKVSHYGAICLRRKIPRCPARQSLRPHRLQLFSEGLPPRPELTDEDRKLIKTSAPLLAPDRLGVKITTRMYERLFSAYPILKNIFSHSKQTVSVSFTSIIVGAERIHSAS